MTWKSLCDKCNSPRRLPGLFIQFLGANVQHHILSAPQMHNTQPRTNTSSIPYYYIQYYQMYTNPNRCCQTLVTYRPGGAKFQPFNWNLLVLEEGSDTSEHRSEGDEKQFGGSACKSI